MGGERPLPRRRKATGDRLREMSGKCDAARSARVRAEGETSGPTADQPQAGRREPGKAWSAQAPGLQKANHPAIRASRRTTLLYHPGQASPSARRGRFPPQRVQRANSFPVERLHCALGAVFHLVWPARNPVRDCCRQNAQKHCASRGHYCTPARYLTDADSYFYCFNRSASSICASRICDQLYLSKAVLTLIVIHA